MATAKVFMSGRSQAVRLPKEFRFDCDEVIIRKMGEMVVLVPKNKAFDIFRESLEGFTDDFVAAVEEAHATEYPSKREEL